MDVTKQNIATFHRGVGLALKAAKPELLKLGMRMADDLVTDALQAYPGDFGLTGNLANSIAGGVYVSGRLEGMVFASDKGVEPPTSTYARVGDRGFVRWGDGKPLKGGFVHQYRKESGLSFQPVGYEFDGEHSAMTFLREFKPRSRYLEIVICAAAPYAEYLQKRKGLDLLTDALNNVGEHWNFNVLAVKPIKL